MPRRGSALLTPLLLTTVLALGLTSCGSNDTDPPADTQASTTTQDGDSIALTVTRDGDTLTPNGKRVELGVDQTLVLTVTSDVAGEFHVHSTPEQEIAYDAGTTEHEITIDRPGVVEVESHEPPLVVLQLEVR